jgi:hypothetical protein
MHSHLVAQASFPLRRKVQQIPIPYRRTGRPEEISELAHINHSRLARGLIEADTSPTLDRASSHLGRLLFGHVFVRGPYLRIKPVPPPCQTIVSLKVPFSRQL